MMMSLSDQTVQLRVEAGLPSDAKPPEEMAQDNDQSTDLFQQ